MKKLLLATIVLTLSAGAQARSILVFKTVMNCQTVTKQEPVIVDVKEAQDGQALLVIAYPLKPGTIIKVLAKKILPPPMSAGTPLKYAGKNEITKENVTLSIGSRPMKVGKVTGKVASLQLEKQDKIDLLCSAVKKE